MYSIAFPKMFTRSRTLLYKDHEAIKSNLVLLLASEKTSLFGDPYYGTRLLPVLFEQNSKIVKDLVIDEIYTSIIDFMPQVYLERKDIDIESDGVDIIVKIRCRYYLDNVADLYEINLTASEELV